MLPRAYVLKGLHPVVRLESAKQARALVGTAWGEGGWSQGAMCPHMSVVRLPGRGDMGPRAAGDNQALGRGPWWKDLLAGPAAQSSNVEAPVQAKPLGPAPVSRVQLYRRRAQHSRDLISAGCIHGGHFL